MWKRFTIMIVLCVCPPAVLAQVPDATIKRLSELEVQLYETNHLLNSQQIDHATHAARSKSITSEINRLWQPYGRLPAAELQQARSRVQGLTIARLTIMETYWEQQARQYAAGQKKRQQDLSAALEADARRALEHQRNRLSLQQQRDRGQIDPATFQTSDAVELAAIQTLRARYQAEGPQYARQFDNSLRLLTAALAGNPSTPLPVAAGKGTGVSAADYKKDVALAADIQRKWTELRKNYEARKISGDTLRETDRVYINDLMRLEAKWQAVSPQKGAQFKRDYTARARGVSAAGTVARAPVYTAPAPKPDRDPNGVLPILLAFGIGGAVVMYFLARSKKPAPDPGPTLSTNYGTATFSPVYADIRDAFAASVGVFLGKSSHPQLRGAPLDVPGAPVFTTPEHHTLIVARTRTGKGTRVIVPTLLRYDGSALVIDPKGENAAITARSRRDRLGQNVHIVNPWNELPHVFPRLGFAPATFNPLDVLDRDDPNVVAIAQSLAATICPTSPGDKDRFWQGSAASVLSAVFLWLTDQPGERKTLALARELISLSRADFTKKVLTKMAASGAYRGAIREMVSPYLDLADETYSGIMSNLNEATKFLSDPQIKAATEASSFALADLIRERTTIYLVIPPDRIDTQRTWLRLVVAAAMHTFKRYPHHDRPAHRCQFLIDEFAALGRIEDLPRDIATMSGYGVDFTLIVQGLDQLRNLYRDAAGTILSNCAYKWFCNLNDLDSAKYVSESLGQATTRTVSKSSSTGTGGDGKSTSGESTSYGEMGRSLLNPDEVLNLGRDVAIALHPTAPPLYVRPVDYWNLGEAFGALREKHPDLYWNPPLAPDPNPYLSRSGDRRPGKVRMTEEEARSVLNVGPTATVEEIRAAYKRLIGKLHPDRDGSTYLTQKINEAKAVLIGE